MTGHEDVMAVVARLKKAMAHVASDEEAREVSHRIARIVRKYRIQNGIGMPNDPVDQALELDPSFRRRAHLDYLGERVAEAVRDVEIGRNRMLAVSMPPRAGKSTLLSFYTPVWLLRRHPEWSIITASYDAGLTSGWARDIRTLIEHRPELGIALAHDNGAQSSWKTEEGGGMYATSVRGSMTGRGARVLVIDDPVKDFIEAHSASYRQSIWDWWLSVAQTRLEPPYLVLVVMTRWHEDDFVGRLLNPDIEGNPKDWEVISLPAIADSLTDVLGREGGQPLISPVIEETADQARTRWESTRTAVGSYTFESMYQQHPAPSQGEIFDTTWWRFWTTNPGSATEDGRVVYLDPEDARYTAKGGTPLVGDSSSVAASESGRWIDSWDMTFKGVDSSDYVVGQRWLRRGPYRYLLSQRRGRWSFTETLAQMGAWSDPETAWGSRVHERIVEDKANGPAVIDVMRRKLSGIIPVTPRDSKEGRARSVTPEIESGHVLLPYPRDPGNAWVNDFLDEFRNFPHGAHDDQVDAATQALSRLRDTGKARIAVPSGTLSSSQRAMTGRSIGPRAGVVPSRLSGPRVGRR